MTSVTNATNPRVISSVFKKYDKDNTGKIDTQELKGLLSDLGFEIDETTRSYVFGAIDADGSGFVTLEEFTEWWCAPEKTQFISFYETSPEWATYSVATFQKYDVNGGKYLQSEEFKKLYNDFKSSEFDGLRYIVNKEGNKTAEQIYKKIDRDHTGINLYEFLEWIHTATKQ
jgi:Ca2+-binding EF-hand superfamily protein